jgi:hypothetical protein
MAGTKPGHDLSAFAARNRRTPKFAPRPCSAPNQSIGDANLCDRCVNLRRMELFAFADIPSACRVYNGSRVRYPRCHDPKGARPC